MRACAVIGVILNVLGTVIAAWALVTENRKHGGKAILPIRAAYRWVRVRLLRRTRELQSATGSATATWNVYGKAGGVAWPPADAPPHEQVTYLQRAVMQLHQRIDTERQEIDAKVQQINESLSLRIGESKIELARVDEKVRALATESARWEVLGLFLIGLGTIIGVVPTVLGWRS